MTAKSRSDRMEKERDRRSREIKDAALRLFSTKGYEGTTIEDIADDLGYAKASLYYYFAGKEAIVKTLIMDAMDAASRRMDELFARTSHPVENLKDLIGYYVDDHADQMGFFNIYHQVGHFMDSILSPEERIEMAKNMKAMNVKIIGLVQRGIDEGYYLPLEAQMLGDLLLGQISGTMRQMARYFRDGTDRTFLKQTITSILIQGILKPQEERHP